MAIETSGRSGPRPARPSFRGIHQRFERRADLDPSAPCVDWQGAIVSYGEIEAFANRVAHRLHQLGIGRGVRVAILLPRSAEVYAVMLGVLKAGAACVPLDVGSSPHGIAHALKDCGAGAFVTTAELARRHVSFPGVVIRMDLDRRAIESRSPQRLTRAQVEVDPRDLCHVIYTAALGRPRGVMIEHRGAVHLVETESRLYGVGARDRVFQGASLASDHSIEEIWLAWRAGATLVPATSEMSSAGPDLSRLLVGAGVTVLSIAPAQLAILADDVPSLRIIILGGDSCHDGLVKRWARPGRRLFRTYGATETTVIATCAELTPGRPVTIGHPIPGNRVILLDEGMRPVAAGDIGEICVGGPGIARGYIGRHEDTRRRFVPDLTARRSEVEARMYRTGDLARLAPEGGYELVRRADVTGELHLGLGE